MIQVSVNYQTHELFATRVNMFLLALHFRWM